ncbi:LysM peptidoglycan-binding domain-containing protein [Streptomyces doebereineriae]|uniref:LysM peptidoglycan-binding domain-containing protein n=1 Tax=Streptomyces doebereineriae TaxID=3075528 RepID=A0ABU2VG15_9ACTN|nr:LysM peptidoglycan-binding domain-containing protein [Streptomyces sp. DSM 41640]MDT0484505.1 LysM peptidoglycan-binding domain-containing protein [Streptomyces sp. DSM 41640]
MRTALSPAATAGRTLARVLKAVLSLIVLAAAVAGLPLLLAWATPAIWGATHDDLTHLLDRQDTGAVFLLLLVAVGWIGWAQFAFCTVRELIAQLRGRTWRAPRGLGSSQRAATLLIGSILVLLPTSSALASDAQAAPATTATLTPGQATQAATAAEADHAPASAASTSSSPSLYTVREMRPAESLWGIAERELGDGERWREIADLNEGRTMAVGHIFRATSFLQPGWQLQMPDAADTAGAVRTQLGDGAPDSVEKGERVVTVHSGDYLSKIAEEELGDGDQWPRLFEASRDKPQPRGLPAISHPDVIYAGQQVTVPGNQPDQPRQDQDQDHGDESESQEATPPTTQKPEGEPTAGGDAGDEQAPAPSNTAAPAPQASAPSTEVSRPAQEGRQDQASPSASASATPGPSTSASPSAASPSAASTGSAASAAATTASDAPVPAPASGPLSLRTAFGAGALLAAAITGALTLRRILQRRRRKPGEKIAISSEASLAEAQLAAAAEPSGAARLDVALRTLAHSAAQEEGAAVMPALRAARIGARTVEVLPEDFSQEAQTPFVSGRGGWWILPPDAVLLDEEAAREVSAPYPGLVTVGSTEADELLLLNLAQLPALLLDGNPVHISEVCTSLALELGMSPWASDVEVVTTGFGEDLPQLLPTTRIAHMRQAAHALRDLSERLLEAHQMPETRHQPYLLLCASSLAADTAWQLADVIDKSGTVPVTLVAPASSAAAHFPDAEILNASLSGPQNLDYAGTGITVQRLEHAAYVQITTALKVSGQPSHPAEGPWQDVPDEPGAVQQPDAPLSVDPIAPTPATPNPSLAGDVVGEAFPALLAATSDPSGLRLLPTTPAQAGARPNPDTGTALSGPDPVAAADTAGKGAAKTDGHKEPTEEGKPETQEGEAHDLHAPEIRVLGPVEVTGVDSTGHGPRMAQLAALLLFRPGRSADDLCSDMDPVSPWSLSTLNARMQGLRRSLGNDPTGAPYVPRRTTGESPYRLSAGVRCDWTRFLQLVERALPLGPAGLTDLERALTLVRGRPFGGKPLPWAEPYQQEMITRIIDVAHTVATYRTPPGPHHNLTAARQAITTGLDADHTAELLYRDWLRIEHAAGNRSGLHTAITRVQQVNRSLDCGLETETEQLINDLLHGSGSALRKAH